MCLYFFPWKSSKICISNFFLDFGRCEACLGLGLVDFLLDGFLVFFFSFRENSVQNHKSAL